MGGSQDLLFFISLGCAKSKPHKQVMTKDITALIEYYERQKGLPRERVLHALEASFISAYKKMVPAAANMNHLNAQIDYAKDKVRIKATVEVVADDQVVDPLNQFPVSLAQKKRPHLEIGDVMTVDVTPKGASFGRIAVQTARQTLVQRLLDAEKELVYEEFKDRAGELVQGTVRRFEKSDVYVDIGKFEGVMPSRERVGGEDYAIGERMTFYVVEVRARKGARDPEVILSRSHPNLVRRLFEAEVAEISDNLVEIRSIAREAGYRIKMAVSSTDPKIDPVGACVGIRGARVKNIVRELNNEKIDIIEWTDDPVEFVKRALAPIEVKEITENTDIKQVMVIVPNEKEQSRAIGRRGLNARLTSRLMGWDVQVRAHDPQDGMGKQLSAAATVLAAKLSVTEDQAMALVMMGVADVNVLVGMDATDIAEAVGMSEEEAASMIERAKVELG